MLTKFKTNIIKTANIPKGGISTLYSHEYSLHKVYFIPMKNDSETQR